MGLNKPVDFTTAKLLKEKGFNKSTTKVYGQVLLDTFKLVNYNFTKMGEEGGFQNAPYYYAPTIAEVVMWLYEKHGIWVSVMITNDFKMFYYNIRSKEAIWYTGTNLNSPKESYTSAIKYCLTKLIK